MAEPPEPTRPEDYPSLGHASDFVLPSIDWTLQRFTAIATRIQHLRGLIATVTVAVPIAASSLDDKVDLLSGWLMASVGLGLGGVLLGALVQTLGSLQMLMVDQMSRPEYLKRHPRSYRRSVLATVGKIQRENRRRIHRRAWAATALGVVLFCELALLVVWFIHG